MLKVWKNFQSKFKNPEPTMITSITDLKLKADDLTQLKADTPKIPSNKPLKSPCLSEWLKAKINSFKINNFLTNPISWKKNPTININSISKTKAKLIKESGTTKIKIKPKEWKMIKIDEAFNKCLKSSLLNKNFKHCNNKKKTNQNLSC